MSNKTKIRILEFFISFSLLVRFDIKINYQTNLIDLIKFPESYLQIHSGTNKWSASHFENSVCRRDDERIAYSGR